MGEVSQNVESSRKRAIIASVTVRVSHPGENDPITAEIGSMDAHATYDDVVKMLPFHQSGIDLLMYGTPVHHHGRDAWTFSAPSLRLEDYLELRLTLSAEKLSYEAQAALTTRDGRISGLRAFLHRSEYYKHDMRAAIQRHPHLSAVLEHAGPFRMLRRSNRTAVGSQSFSLDEVSSITILEHMRLQREILYLVVEKRKDWNDNDSLTLNMISETLAHAWQPKYEFMERAALRGPSSIAASASENIVHHNRHHFIHVETAHSYTLRQTAQ
jgi:hypothetical protein